jgi:hypothetical protein
MHNTILQEAEAGFPAAGAEEAEGAAEERGNTVTGCQMTVIVYQ